MGGGGVGFCCLFWFGFPLMTSQTGLLHHTDNNVSVWVQTAD